MNVSVDRELLSIRLDLTTDEAEMLVAALSVASDSASSAFALDLLNAIIAAIGKELAR